MVKNPPTPTGDTPCTPVQDLDDESGLPHLAHAAWHCLALLAYQQHDTGLDTRNPWNKNN